MKIKLTAILPLYLAGIILLAFAVFPHHHHDNFICFNTAHCQDTNNSDHHDCNDHAPFKGVEGCLQHLFQTEVTKSLSLSHACEDGHCHHFTLSFFILAGMTDALQFESKPDILPDILYHEKLHSTLYATGKPTRAPPVL